MDKIDKQLIQFISRQLQHALYRENKNKSQHRSRIYMYNGIEQSSDVSICFQLNITGFSDSILPTVCNLYTTFTPIRLENVSNLSLRHGTIRKVFVNYRGYYVLYSASLSLPLSSIYKINIGPGVIFKYSAQKQSDHKL